MRPARVTTITTVGQSTSKPLVTTTRARIDEATVQTPAALARTLQQMQDAQDATTRSLTSNPHAAPSIVRRVQLSGTSVVVVRHALGRPYTGWWICRVWPHGSGAFALPTELGAGDAGYPMGANTATSLVLKSRSTDLVDVCITGE